MSATPKPFSIKRTVIIGVAVAAIAAGAEIVSEILTPRTSPLELVRDLAVDSVLILAAAVVIWRVLRDYRNVRHEVDAERRMLQEEARRPLEQKERIHAVLLHANRAMTSTPTREGLCREICEAFAGAGQMRLAWVGFVDAATSAITPCAVAGPASDYLDGLSISTDESVTQGQGPTGRAARSGVAEICQDIAHDARMVHWVGRAARFGLRSNMAMPIRHQGRVVGTFTVYSGEVNFFGTEIVELLEMLTRDIEHGLDLIAENAAFAATRSRLELLSAALRTAPIGVVITDRDGLIEWVSAGFTRLTGYTESEAIGMNPRILKSGMQNQAFYVSMWRQINSGEIWLGELKNRRKDGTIYDEAMTIAPVRDEHGQIQHFVAIKLDVTDRKVLEQQLLRAQRLEGIGLLAGGIAHDLNNVLTPILLSVELLKQRFPQPEASHILMAVDAAARRGAGVVRQVLTFARGVEGDRAPLRPKDLIRELVLMVEETFPRNIEVLRDVAEPLPLVLGDPTQLHQVLLNLAVNARDAMPQGGSLVFHAKTVRVAAHISPLMGQVTGGDYVLLTVEDTGMGMSPEVQARLFEPFFTTKAPGKGTGLGLSTVFGVVRSHHGFIEVQSAEGKGTEFRIYLPALPVETGGSRPPLPTGITVDGQGRTILVCDDEALVREATQQVLANRNFKVLQAEDGSAGVAAWDALHSEISLVILDVMMPGLTGDQVALAIRRRNPNMPIIFSSGIIGDPVVEKELKELCDHPRTVLLTKPYPEEVLLQAIQRILEPSRDTGTAAAG